MDPVNLAFKVLKSVARSGSKYAIVSANSLLNKIDPDTQQARSALLAHCSPLDIKEKLLEIHQFLETTTADLKESLTAEIAQLQLTVQHRDVDSSLSKINYYLTLLLKSDATSRDYDKKEFLRACKNYDPKGLLAALHEDVTGAFLTRIIDNCTYQFLLQWCDKISLNALRAYLCSMHRLYVMMEDDQSLVTSTTLNREDVAMTGQVKSILKAVKLAKFHYETRIFAVSEKGPSDLVALIDEFFVNSDNESKTAQANQDLAVKLGEKLNKQFSWYSWAVVIAEDNPKELNFLSYSADFEDDLFSQESTHQQFLPFFGSKSATAPMHENIVSGSLNMLHPRKYFSIVTVSSTVGSTILTKECQNRMLSKIAIAVHG
ncbi:uncharacterized protein LOC129586544 isoform X2 [Paramacrobiotus metropolitanus]|uniref:uncharacterized protein LOC129586544 isoform X2 n=1 Tax=Paramacrobiotus metropolitanus TaxID=2943436 RepID=UPI002445958F|nr:uncharacterized protein LOC129586544 isoform X2 [Paramacrobiotus metropolitanus]